MLIHPLSGTGSAAATCGCGLDTCGLVNITADIHRAARDRSAAGYQSSHNRALLHCACADGSARSQTGSVGGRHQRQRCAAALQLRVVR